MTPVAALDPVAATALANGLTTAVGLGPLVCARCKGRRCPVSILPFGCAFYAGHDGEHLTPREAEGYRTECPDCHGTGLVQPSGPQTMLIGATADMSDDLVYDYQDHLAAVDGPADVVWTSIGPHWGWHLAIRPAGEEWTYRPIHPASILGTATVELVPCYESGDWPDDLGTKWVRVSSGRLSLYDGDGAAYEINEALPFGPWTPGGLAAIVTDYRPTIDCPNRVDVERDGCGKWWVTLDGTRVSDHRDHVAARTAARRHLLVTTVACPLPWPAAPSSPCVTTIDLGESGAA